ncbi:MAG: MFS transporter [Gammaproteobacteria bacterium]|nr:MAG: MFS transporter [Gammaproteobacteria bacterium]
MPYWRLSGFYFFYFAALGALVPYWGLYLKSIGFSALQIGNLMALLMVSRIIAPNIWGWIADHRGQRLAVVRWAAFFSALAFAGVFLSTHFWWLVLVIMTFSFFWNASLPQVEAATMSHYSGSGGDYARVRLWGSVGFIVAVVGLGYLFDVATLWWLLPVMLILLIGIWLYSLVIPESAVKLEETELQPLLKVIMRPEVFAFLLASLLMQASHGPYYTFYTIYMEDNGYSRGVIGWLWALGVLCEIGVFIVLHRMRRHFSLRAMLMLSFGLAALRWLIIGYFPRNLSLIIVAQILHAATFGAYHATAIEMVHNFFTGRHQIRGQAIYGSISFGIGGALGGFYSGITWKALGPDVTFVIASLLASAAFIIAWVGLRQQSQN